MKSPMRAQRKFAAGSRPESPCTSPLKLNKKSRTPRKLLNTSKRAKTEDFLTFLCLRGLWYYNISEWRHNFFYPPKILNCSNVHRMLKTKVVTCIFLIAEKLLLF